MPNRQWSHPQGPNIALHVVTTYDEILSTTLGLPASSHGLHVHVERPFAPQHIQTLQAWVESYCQRHPLSTDTLPLMLLKNPKQAPFLHKAWQAMQEIPFGTTLSYRGLAALAGNPKAARAAGSACKNNLFPLLLPCHRILASNGTLGGFSQDLQVKTRLLAFEGSLPQIGTPLASFHGNDPQGGCHEQPKRDDAQASTPGVRK